MARCTTAAGAMLTLTLTAACTGGKDDAGDDTTSATADTRPDTADDTGHTDDELTDTGDSGPFGDDTAHTDDELAFTGDTASTLADTSASGDPTAGDDTAPTPDDTVDTSPTVDTIPAFCPMDRFEPNDATADATLLSVTPGVTRVEAALDADGRGVTDDWYAFLVPPDCTAIATVRFAHAEGDLDVELYAGGILVDQSTTRSDDELVAWRNGGSSFLPPTPVGVRVQPEPSLGAFCSTYDLELRVDCPGPSCPPDVREPNGDAATATPLPLVPGVPLVEPDVAMDGGATDRDWYAFTVPDGCTVTLDLRFSHAEGDIDAILADRGLVTRAVGFSGSDDESLVWTNSTGAATELTLQVYSWDTTCQLYDLEAALSCGSTPAPPP